MHHGIEVHKKSALNHPWFVGIAKITSWHFGVKVGSSDSGVLLNWDMILTAEDNLVHPFG